MHIRLLIRSLKYSLSNSEGSEILAGEKQIKGVIPTGDQRTFFHVNLGTTEGAPARLRSDLLKVTASIPSDLPTGFPSRFSSAMTSEEPLDELTALQNDAPKYAPLMITIGILNEERKNWKEAAQYFQQAVELAPENANAHYHLGVVLMREKQDELALKHIRKAAQLNDNDPEINRTLESFKTGDEAAAAAMR